MNSQLLKFLYLIQALTMFTCLNGLAQPEPTERKYNHHSQLWLNLSLSKRVRNTNFELSSDVQHRRQSVNNKYFQIAKAYQYQAYRLWLNYRTGNSVISFSPFMYVHEVPLSDDGWSFIEEPQEEFRPSVRYEQKNESGKIKICNRYGFEYRYRRKTEKRDEAWHEWRIRYMLRLEKSLTESTGLIFQNEVFLSLGKYIQSNIFDHNRTMLALKYNGLENREIVAGYMINQEMLRSGKEFNLIHIIYLSLSFYNVFNQLK
ncbi:MAG: DUF2490 domain-containing protein [Cytophagaceae bacterium]